MNATRSTPTIPPFVNRMMKFILRSPFHGLVSKSMMLISFQGRKTGKTYTTPVSYSRHGDLATVFTHAGWWKNLRGGAPVIARIQGRDVHGWAQPVDQDKASIADGLAAHLQKVRSDAGFYGVSFDESGKPKRVEVENAVHTVVMICIRV